LAELQTAPQYQLGRGTTTNHRTNMSRLNIKQVYVAY